MTFKIIHTSDIHGYLYPTDYVTSKNIGILSLYSEIIKYKDDSTLLIDGGDYIQGSALAHYLSHVDETQKNVFTDIFNAADYDCVSLGNHEFNFGSKYLKDIYSKLDADVLCANINGLDFTIPYQIYEQDGYKIGVIGLSTQSIAYYEKEVNLEGLEIENVIDCYKRYEEQLQQKCDYIIVNYHGGIEYDLDDLETPIGKNNTENLAITLFKTYSSIDLILSAHQHQTFIRDYDNRIIVQSGDLASGFSFLEIDLKTKKLINSEYVLNKGILSNLEMYSHSLDLDVNTYLDTVLSRLDKDIILNDIFKARYQGHPLVNFIHDVQLNSTGADISVMNLYPSSIGFKNEITMRQIIANYPYANTLVKLKIHRDELIEVLEICASYFELDVNNNYIVSEKFYKPKDVGYFYDFFKGFNYTFDISKPVGSRLVFHDLEDKYYSICLSNFRAYRTPFFKVYEKLEVIEKYDLSMNDNIVDYLNKHQELCANDIYNFKIIGGNNG